MRRLEDRVPVSRRYVNTYFDNAATSFPKPAAVGEAMLHYLRDVGGAYGRSSHALCLEVSRTVEETRDAAAGWLGTSIAAHVVFLPNATAGLNLALQGILHQGATVFVSALEHNAVMRPLHALAETRGIRWQCLPCHADGLVDLAKIPAACGTVPDLLVINHQSNVNGVVQPLADLRQKLPGVPILVDASQSLGHEPMRADEWELDAVAWTGHKGLLGPPGTGGLFLRNPDSVPPLVYGGTGSRSADFEMPDTLPDKFEAGTPNVAGLFGLLAGMNHRPKARHETAEWIKFIGGLREVPGLRIYAASDAAWQGNVVSVQHDRLSPSALGDILWRDHQIAVRVGLHCSPLAHRHLGTFPGGTVRFAVSPYHTAADFDNVLSAVEKACCP